MRQQDVVIAMAAVTRQRTAFLCFFSPLQLPPTPVVFYQLTSSRTEMPLQRDTTSGVASPAGLPLVYQPPCCCPSQQLDPAFHHSPHSYCLAKLVLFMLSLYRQLLLFGLYLRHCTFCHVSTPFITTFSCTSIF